MTYDKVVVRELTKKLLRSHLVAIRSGLEEGRGFAHFLSRLQNCADVDLIALSPSDKFRHIQDSDRLPCCTEHQVNRCSVAYGTG